MYYNSIHYDTQDDLLSHLVNNNSINSSLVGSLYNTVGNISLMGYGGGGVRRGGGGGEQSLIS